MHQQIVLETDVVGGDRVSAASAEGCYMGGNAAESYIIMCSVDATLCNVEAIDFPTPADGQTQIGARKYPFRPFGPNMTRRPEQPCVPERTLRALFSEMNFRARVALPAWAICAKSTGEIDLLGNLGQNEHKLLD